MMGEAGMYALVYREAYRMEWTKVPFPQVRDDELLIQPRTVSICGSDLNGFRGRNSMRVAPLIMGHEFSGIVLKGGTRTSLAPGTRVAVNPAINCGSCVNCNSGHPNLCDRRKVVGTSMPAGNRDGAMAEFVAVPERSALRMPDHLSFDAASLLEPLAVSYHAVSKAGALAGKRVAVIGAGPIGLLAILCIARQRPALLCCTDLSPVRLQMALRCGASHILQSVTAAEELHALTQQGKADVVIDAVGIEATVRQSMQMVRNGGQIIVVGMGTDEIAYPIKKLAEHEIQMVGSYTYTDEMNSCLSLLPSMDVERIITARYPLQRGQEAFSALAREDTTEIKVVLVNEKEELL